ncbi:MAG: hypothetical protein ACKV2T_37225 [Kofleriaceae bacterium]
MYNLDLVDAAFKDAFPARTEATSLEYVSVESKGEGKLAVVMRVIRWDVHTETGVQSIRDVIEQEVGFTMNSLDLTGIGRLREYVAALVKVIEKALLHPDTEVALPHDLMDFSALKLAKANTEAEFIAALSVASRLGKYLAMPPR